MTELLKMTKEEELKVLETFVEYLKENEISIKYEEEPYHEYDPFELSLNDWVDSGYTNDGSELKINNDFLAEKVENEYYESSYPYVYGEYFQYEMEDIIDNYIDTLEEKNDAEKEVMRKILLASDKFDIDYSEYVDVDYDLDGVFEDYKIPVDILIDNDNLNTEGSNLEYAISSIREMLKNEYDNSLIEMKNEKSDADFVFEKLSDQALNVLGFLRYRYEDMYNAEDVVDLLNKVQKQIANMTSVLGHFENAKLLNRITEGDQEETNQMYSTFEEVKEYMDKAYDSIDDVVDDLSRIRELEERRNQDEEIIDKTNIENYVDKFTPILFKSQGYQISDLCDDEKVKNSEFLKSFLTEMSELYNIGVYTVSKIFNLRELKEVVENRKEIIIEKDDVIGMFDPVQGGGSLMDISLEKGFTVPLSYVKLSNQNDSSYGYSTTDVYGSLI